MYIKKDIIDMIRQTIVKIAFVFVLTRLYGIGFLEPVHASSPTFFRAR